MSSVYAENKLRSKRNYIATSTFGAYMYGYSTTLNPTTFNTTGALTALPSATATNAACPQGRILREIGSRLYPGAHPGVSTLMMQVYDPNSGIRAYIDPNAPVFSVYNSDKPVEITDGFEVGTTTAHKGQPVFTSGDVIFGGNLRGSTSRTITAGSTSYNFSTNSGLTYNYSNNGGNVTLTATPPAAGTIISICFTGAATTTLGSGFAPTATVITTTNAFVITFISNGTSLVEISRSASFSTPPTI